MIPLNDPFYRPFIRDLCVFVLIPIAFGIGAGIYLWWPR
jgi:hypothetical protein